ncbi:MAG: YraN family protein [Gammaproteobacteria bacterium]|nr:YraN family protein [Gammaproteobacteria bacterium]
MQGRRAEQRAKEFLQRQGLILIDKNYRCRHGEIDLIMKDGSQLVFIEVRYRKNEAYGGPLASIDHRKKNHLIATALHYLQSKRLQGTARVDVLGITGENQIDWVENAVEVDYS